MSPYATTTTNYQGDEGCPQHPNDEKYDRKWIREVSSYMILESRESHWRWMDNWKEYWEASCRKGEMLSLLKEINQVYVDGTIIVRSQRGYGNRK